MAVGISALFVRNIKRPGKYSDGRNLYLQVQPSRKSRSGVTKCWLFRYQRDGKQTWMGLGPYPEVSLAEARDEAFRLRRKIYRGVDPMANKREAEANARKRRKSILSFAQCAERYVNSQAPGWSNEKHIAQWRRTLKDLAGPVFGHLPVNQVETAHVMRCLEPLWTTKTETASRLRGRIESVLAWATVQGYREGDNPAQWKNHLDKLLPRPSQVAKVKHHPALPYTKIGEFMKELRETDGTAARALEFTILTAARTSEVIHAQWDEIDLSRNLWLIPAERTKSKREHRVPLSKAALDAVRSLKTSDSDYVFASHRPDQCLSNAAMLKVLERMNFKKITVHGFRSTFRDWVADCTAYPGHVAEMALAHVVRDKTEAAYRRGDLLEKRACLMTDWADFCSKVHQPAKVLDLRSTGSLAKH